MVYKNRCLPKQPISSSPNGQSKYPSQSLVISTLDLQLHFNSSLISEQSTIPSHHLVEGIQVESPSPQGTVPIGHSISLFDEFEDIFGKDVCGLKYKSF